MEFLRLVIQAMISSVQVPSRTKDLEMGFINVVKDVLVGRIPFSMDTSMEVKHSLSVLLRGVVLTKEAINKEDCTK